MKKLFQFFKGIIKKGTIIQKTLLILFVVYIPVSLFFIWEEQGHPLGVNPTVGYDYDVGDYVYLKGDLIFGKVVNWTKYTKGVTYQELIVWLCTVSFLIFCMYVFQRNKKSIE